MKLNVNEQKRVLDERAESEKPKKKEESLA